MKAHEPIDHEQEMFEKRLQLAKLKRSQDPYRLAMNASFMAGAAIVLAVAAILISCISR